MFLALRSVLLKHFVIFRCSSIFLRKRPSHGEALNLVYVSQGSFGAQKLQHVQILVLFYVL